MNHQNEAGGAKRGGPDVTLDLKYYMFDWDDNILHMPTRIHLERKTADGDWEPYDVSTAEFARIRRDTVRYRPLGGDWDRAFVDFYDVGERGEDVFLEDTRIALAPVIAGHERGAPSFDRFKNALIEGRLFAIITARSHSSRGIRKGVEYFIYNALSAEERRRMVENLRAYVWKFEGKTPNESDEQILSNYLDLNRYHGVTSPEFESKMGYHSGGSESPEHAKKLAIVDFVAHVVELIKGAGQGVPVSIGFSDDDRKNVEAVEAYIKEVLREKYPEIKFVIYDTSDPERQNGRKVVISGSNTA